MSDEDGRQKDGISWEDGRKTTELSTLERTGWGREE